MRTRIGIALLALSLSCTAPADEAVPPDDTNNPPGTMKPRDMKLPVIEQNMEGLKSGTRLKQRFAVGEDGSQRHMATWDTKLNLECNFEEAEDGKVRCLPTLVATRLPTQLPAQTVVLELFRDLACSERIAISSLCAPAARYIKFTDTCGGKTRLVQAIEISTPSSVYYKATDGSCRPTVTQNNGFANWRLYAYGPAVAPEEFVAATVVTE